jgi:hypothetical protein
MFSSYFNIIINKFLIKTNFISISFQLSQILCYWFNLDHNNWYQTLRLHLGVLLYLFVLPLVVGLCHHGYHWIWAQLSVNFVWDSSTKWDRGATPSFWTNFDWDPSTKWDREVTSVFLDKFASLDEAQRREEAERAEQYRVETGECSTPGEVAEVTCLSFFSYCKWLIAWANRKLSDEMVLWSSKDRVIDSEGVIKAERQCTVYEGRSRLSGGVDAPYQVAARERERVAEGVSR